MPHEPFLPPQEAENKGRITMLLDLDETLIHGEFGPVEKLKSPPDYSRKFKIGKEDYAVHVYERPGA